MRTDYLLSTRRIKDFRGDLFPIEFLRDVPFSAKRIYILTHLLSNEARGFHAHKTLRQAAICVQGECDFILDDGNSRQLFHLKADNDALLLVEPMIWHEMKSFTPDCILLILASEWYDESDYIRDYQLFQELISLQGKRFV